MFRSRSNFMGYLKNPESTRGAFSEDRWIKSGDVGFLDACENLYIDGRIKELIITTGGVKISPHYIETMIKIELPCLSNVVVIGDRRKYLTALITFKVGNDKYICCNLCFTYILLFRPLLIITLDIL